MRVKIRFLKLKKERKKKDPNKHQKEKSVEKYNKKIQKEAKIIK